MTRDTTTPGAGEELKAHLLAELRIRQTMAKAGGADVIKFSPAELGEVIFALSLGSAASVMTASGSEPIPMVLHCPACGVQHIDEATATWPNPPHRSHLCDRCGHVWRPADVATVGVAAVTTCGAADSRIPTRPVAGEGETKPVALHPEPKRTAAVISEAYAYLSTVRSVDGVMPAPALLVQRLQSRLERISKHLARHAPPPPAEAWKPDREAVARLIEPLFWTDLDNALGWVRDNREQQGWSIPRFLKRELEHVQEIYSWADLILALPTPAKGGE